MHPIRKQRLQVVLLIVVASSLAAGLIAYMLGQNANYFFTPSQVLQGAAPENVTIRAGVWSWKALLKDHQILWTSVFW